MFLVIMVPLVSFLAALRILTEAQICNNGEGKIVYEKIVSIDPIHHTSNASSYEIISRNSLPLKVLEECFRRCQEDRLNKITTCAKFDFLPGKKRLESSRNSGRGLKGQLFDTQPESNYHETHCVLYNQSNESVNLKEISSNHGSVWKFQKVCLSAQLINRNCPDRLYVFEKISQHKMVDEKAKEVEVADKTECENKCLTERFITCRSASYHQSSNKCYLSEFNRHVMPSQFKQDPEFEYLENMCLKYNEMCKWNVFVVDVKKQLSADYEKISLTSHSVNNCSSTCLESLNKYGFVCRSFMFDEIKQSCVLYDEDPMDLISFSNETTTSNLIFSTGNLYRVLCSTDEKDKEMDNQTLECYRHKRLRGRHQMETSASNFYECLSGCLKQLGKGCRSIEYSHSKQICRFSGFTVTGPVSHKDKDTLIDDDSFDYYQFMWNNEYGASHERTRPLSDSLSDKQDSIEMSNSQPGNYGNFVLPNGDHHRDGLTYHKSPSSIDYTPQSSVQMSQKPSVAGMGTKLPPNSRNEFQARSPPRFQMDHKYEHLNGGSSMGRTAVVSNAIPPLNNRFVTYGVPPYAGVSQSQLGVQQQSSGQHYPPLSPGVNGQTGPHGAAHSPAQQYSDRFGLITPSATRPNENSIPSSGCKFDPNTSGDTSTFRRVGFSSRLKSKHIYKVVRADRLEDCEKFCHETKDFVCKSFNFRAFFPDNCELSNVDTKKIKLENVEHFEHNTQFDYYERVERKAMMAHSSMDCFEVLQTCSPEGMELKLKTTEGFYGRIYTYGFYDSCFFDGNGGTSSILRISKPNGFPRCGTQQVGDAMTNIVVVQFSDYVQTSRDKKYNLTCFLSGPGEAVVTSNYLDTKTDGRHPMQIEHLPAQNILTSNIVLRILYRGTPTNTIVVGDLLTFRLEARSQYRYNGYHSDIFATNVIAKDPYTGRQVLLIDSRGCPVDLFVFPELHKTPDGALEAEFYAFKIPDSNFLVFQATVKTCKGPCEPVICTDRSRGQGSFPSWGRRKRAISSSSSTSGIRTSTKSGSKKDEEEVHELLRVYLSHDDVPEMEKLESSLNVSEQSEKMCIDKTTYYLMVLISALFVIIVLICLPYCTIVKLANSKYKGKSTSLGKHWTMRWRAQMPHLLVRRPLHATPYLAGSQVGMIGLTNQTTLEPVYCETSSMERSRSLQSLTVQDANRVVT